MNSFRVLLVEDNPDDEFLAVWTLKKEGDVSLKVARDGREALDLLRSSGEPLPDLVILDLRLPKIDGIEVLRRIREEETTRRLPVLVLTSSEDRGDKEICRDYGILAFLSKPLRRDDLRRAITAVSNETRDEVC